MKADAITSVVAMAAACRVAHAFQTELRPLRSLGCPANAAPSPLFVKNKKGGGGGKGFSKEPKYSIEDKSYGSASPVAPSGQTPEDAQSSMSDFFSTYQEWKPLFRNVMSENKNNNNGGDGIESMASSFLSDVDRSPEQLFGISTLEQRNPWRLLPPKPESDASLGTIATFLDEWQQSLLDIPLDSIITGDNDMHFLEEGRRTIAVTRFHVLDEHHNHWENNEGGGTHHDWETKLFRTCWSELAHLMSQDDIDTGSMVILPNHILGREEEEGEEGSSDSRLEHVRDFVENNLVRPIRWLGREQDLEIVAMERGGLAVRLLYKLSDIPDLNERDSGGDEEVRM